MTTQHMPKPKNESVLIEFDDNRLLSELYGEHDKHLVQLEKALGVTLINRGNQVAISGTITSIVFGKSGTGSAL